MQLFFRLQGLDDWESNPHYRLDKPLLSEIRHEIIQDYLNDPEWTRAVFLRDPAERLLSAYLDKVELKLKGIPEIRAEGRKEESFSEFTTRIIDTLGEKTNPHWKPQGQVASLEKFLPCINFIGHFTHLENHGRQLLEQLDLWQRYGEHGWGHKGEQSLFASNNAHNRTDALVNFDKYYTDELLAQVKGAYVEDYKLIDNLRPRMAKI